MNRRDELIQLTNKIPDPIIRAFTGYVLESAPKHFWTKPSSAGKYHPFDEHGAEGLVLHTIRVVGIGEVIVRSRPDLNANVILSACILHDICRYGDTEAPAFASLNNHPELAEKFILRLAGGVNSPGYVISIASCVLTHMGRWGTLIPSTDEEWSVHLADNIASKTDNWISRVP